MKDKKKIQNFIKNLLQAKKNLPKDVIKNLEKFDYLDYGQIDSLELITFISKIENKFKFKFTSKELSSRKFRNVLGLIEIILKRKKL